MDNLSLVELFAEFVGFTASRKPIDLPILYQNSTLVISLITKGGGTTRIKHLRALIHLDKEAVDEKRAADGFGKSFDPADNNGFAQLA